MTKNDDSKDASQNKNTPQIDLKEKLRKAQEAEIINKEAEKAKLASTNNDEIEILKAKLEEMTELNKRLLADMQNQKRRADEDRSRTILMANANLIKNLLPTIDNLTRAMEHTPEQSREGLAMCMKQIEETLSNAGLTHIEAINQPFNPDLHEAVVQGPGEKDVVIEEFEKGYTISGQVIRHSKVKVGNGEI